jgi:ubiquinone/menaquinone biosynthesis C-methylase UbiE
MEAFLAGNKLQACRTAFLHLAGGCRNVLLLGEGNGRFLVACRTNIPNARITVVDSSRLMLDSAAARLLARGFTLENISMHCADVRTLDLGTAEFDLIATNFFLDCFGERDLPPLLEKIGKAARPRCLWLLSDFRIPPHGIIRLRALIIHRLMYAFFRTVTGLPASRIVLPDEMLHRSGFDRQAQRTMDWDLLVSEVWVKHRD